MNGHVKEWLGAYLDGELGAARRQRVQAHLDECADCRAELESLRRVSTLLQSAPEPEFTPPEPFAARLALVLPRPEQIEKQAGRPSVLWYLIPAVILAAWFFYQTVLTASGLTALSATLLGPASQAAPKEGAHSLWFIALTGLLGGWLTGLPHAVLAFFDQLSLLAADALGRLFWQALIGAVYLAWLAFWWVRQAPRPGELRGGRIQP